MLQRLLQIAGFIICALPNSPIQAADTTLTVVVVYGAPGHAAVHLDHAGQQLYWDPGGAYGTERDVCLQDFSESYCERFDGFPWDGLKAARNQDIFMGEMADLLRVISIYHLDGDDKVQTYRYELTGALADKAWNLLAAGSDAFNTDREPMFCVKGVTEYLETLGGQFAHIEHPWYPEELGDEMAKLGAKPSGVYTLQSPDVQQYIQQTRHNHGLAALDLSPHPEQQEERF